MLVAALPFSNASAHHPEHIDQLRSALNLTLARPETDGHKTAQDATRALLQERAAALGLTVARTSDDDDFEDLFDTDGLLELEGRGRRLEPNATTDVWALNDFAYTGTFNSPCGGEEGAGVWVWDVDDAEETSLVTVIPSPVGSRSNDVKAANMNSGAILVHSNEPCAGGTGGFEIYNVDDPTNPVHLVHVQVDEINELTPLFFGGPGSLDDNGVHNLWLFTQGDRDLVAAQSEGVFDGFQIFDITVPTNPVLVSGWGAEEVFDPGVGDLDDPTDGDQLNRVLAAAVWLLEGFGASQNRFLHDFTITPDGKLAYLAHWDAGLILLDISDVANPRLISVALDPTSEDGEVNSHSVWPSEDGTVVVEGEEDFAPFEAIFRITSGTNAGQFPAAEGSFTTPITSLPGREMSGPTVYVGLACTGGDPVPPAASAGQVALIQRGACRFDDKATNAISAGYGSMVVFNNVGGGDGLITMGGASRDIPGVFVGHSTGLLIAGITSAADLVIGAAGASISVVAEPNGWSGLRVWDYSDPANPILASTFNTTCSEFPDDPSCDPRGTYSSHNMVTETVDGRVQTYVSWYSEGVLVVDVTDPFNPVEVTRFHGEGAAFEAENGGIQDVWGIFKEAGEETIYASDRNGGLYVLEDETDDFELKDDDDDEIEVAEADDD